MLFDVNQKNGIAFLQRSRRAMLKESVLGFGAVGLMSLLAEEGLLSADDGAPAHAGQSHFPATAKNVIFLFMSGGPSQVDTFDPKPLLTKLEGQAVPDAIAARVPNIPRAGLGSKLMASPFTFQKYGESGIEVSNLFPSTAEMVDELCLLRAVNHRVPVHGPGECIALTGSAVGDRPSLGAWMTYGLGSESRDLPAFISMLSNSTGPAPQTPGWGAGFLPSRYQGTLVDGKRGIPYTRMPAGYSNVNRREQLDFIKWMNEKHLNQLGEDSELEARIASYELGFRLQTSAPEVFDLESETAETAKLYGLDAKPTAEFGRHCLIARRLVERGVRVVQLRNGGWDAHGSLKGNHIKQARATDVPIAGLLKDLKQRGLLDDTLVIWGGEFGRTPTTEGSAKGDRRGRDHLPTTYCMWMAGGGVQGGQIIGQTDELGYTPVERPVSPADLHATLLHALGLDQHKLFFRHNNRKEIATVLGGEVISEVFG
ncbi:hypothetical protein CA11_15460 [Gimesia maris]|uniref:DUF1501 domain-containing protein n=1 Tax=Gimesia maris TaxID=122 RepID=UPI001188E3B1|nr:DUF1501 domain-containing protein [Gimesia maris]QDU13760.1 hypothetical protein CA11_15460 [Gimesia maris]